jgi:multiple sugar transport system substrate-binding protein
MRCSVSRLFPAVLLATLILSACGSVPTPTPATPSTPAGTGTPMPSPTVTPSATATTTTPLQVDLAALSGVHIQVWDAFSGAASQAFVDQAAAFNTNNTWNIVVYPNDYGDYTTLLDAVNAGLQAGQTPDLVVALPEQVLAWDASKAVVDLNPYVGDPTWGLSAGDMADIPAAFWSQDTVGGRRLGVPAARSAHYLFYNATWAHELGFTAPPGTADDFRKQACAANASFRTDSNPQNDGYGGWVVDTTWQTTLSWMAAFGGSVLQDGAYSFRNDQNLAALQYLKKLYDDHCAWISTDPVPYDAFAGRAALFISGDLAEVPMVANAMARAKNTDEWTLIPFPGPQDSALVAYGPSVSVLASTPEKQLAGWLFARWLLSPENQVQWVHATGLLPVRSSALTALTDYRSSRPQWDAAVGALGLDEGAPELASWRSVRYLLDDGLSSIFRTNMAVGKIPAVLAQMDAMAAELGKTQ